MERLNISEYSKILYRYTFLLSLVLIFIVNYNYVFLGQLLGEDKIYTNYWHNAMNCAIGALLAYILIRNVLIPVKQHVLNPDNQELEKNAYRALCKVPNYSLIYMAVITYSIFILSFTTFTNPENQLWALILNFSFLGSLVGYFYLYANYRISFNLQHFRNQEGITNFSMRKRLTLALSASIFGLLVNTIFTFLLIDLNTVDIILAALIFWVYLIPIILVLISITVNLTIGPIQRINSAWDSLQSNGKFELPNICVGEMAELTSRFQSAVVSVQNQLKENLELSQELSNLATDLSTNAETVSSTCQNIASSQQFIAKGAANQTNAILKMQQRIDYVASGIGKIQEKVTHISNVSDTIKSIANQTNILSLNAAIEAARAGEAGRGFNVVADQVRKLADESKKAVNNTDQMVNEIQLVANQQNNSVKELLHEITDLSTVAEETSANTEEVSAAAEEQSASMEQISSSAERLANLASLLNRKKSNEKDLDHENMTPKDGKKTNYTPMISLPSNSVLKN